MNECITIVIAMLAVYGFYSALGEIRTLLRRISARRIDNEQKKRYNVHMDPP